MLFLRDGKWHCDCERPLHADKEVATGQCTVCADANEKPPSETLLQMIRDGRVLDMRDDRWQTGCPR